MLSLQTQYTGEPKEPLSKKISLKNIEAMKIPYNPTLKASLAARLDCFVESILPIFKEQGLKANTSIQVDASVVVAQAKYMIEDYKYQFIKTVDGSFGVKYHDQIGKWIDSKISLISLPGKKTGSIKDVINICSNFWKDCFVEWSKKNDLEKYIPDKELEGRMIKLCKDLSLEEPECSVFALCYLKIENILSSNFGMQIGILKEKGYRLVTKPLANDVIIYYNSANEPDHIGVFFNSTRVISKLGKLCILKHNPEDHRKGKSYIILRKPMDHGQNTVNDTEMKT